MTMPCPFCAGDLPSGEAAPPSCPRCARPLSVCGGFQVKRLLGRGGMGLVYEASHPERGPAAVKMLALGGGADWKTHELFTRGSEVLKGLSHPGLPAVYAFEEDPGGRL